MLITKHAFQRLRERVNENITDDQAIELATKAYYQGKTSGHFIETDIDLAMYLSHKQNKYINKTIRLLDNMIYVYDLAEKVLITCYPSNFNSWKNNCKKYLQKN